MNYDEISHLRYYWYFSVETVQKKCKVIESYGYCKKFYCGPKVILLCGGLLKQQVEKDRDGQGCYCLCKGGPTVMTLDQIRKTFSKVHRIILMTSICLN